MVPLHDGLFTRWQTDPAHPERLVPDAVYGSWSNVDIRVGGTIQNLNHNVEPWSTVHSFDQFGDEHFTRPWYSPDNQGFPPSYNRASVITPRYDTNLQRVRAPAVAHVAMFNQLNSLDLFVDRVS
jgi:hypothetical protein